MQADSRASRNPASEGNMNNPDPQSLRTRPSTRKDLKPGNGLMVIAWFWAPAEKASKCLHAAGSKAAGEQMFA